MPKGGNPLRVRRVTGRQVVGGKVTPVYGYTPVTLPHGLVPVGGNSLPIVVVSDADMAAMGLVAEGDPQAMPVIEDIYDGVQVEGGSAQLVYPVNSLVGGGQWGGHYTQLFDQGEAVSIIETDGGTKVRINPYLDVNSQTEWFCIRSDVGGKPTFYIERVVNFAWLGGLSAACWNCCWSTNPDTDTWNKFDHVTMGATDMIFWNDNPFPSTPVYIAWEPMYPFSRTQRVLAAWALNALVSNPPSAVSGLFTIARAPQLLSLDNTGRVTPIDLPYLAFKVSNSSTQIKNKIILSARQHACEGTGGYMLEGAIDWLLLNAQEQHFLLDYCDFYVYPNLYPENTWAGHSRMEWDNLTIDPNQRWDTSGVSHHIDVFKSAFVADTGGTIEAGIDFHGFYSASAYPMGDIYNAADPMFVDFESQMQTYDVGYSHLQEILDHALSTRFTQDYGARLAMTQEQRQSLVRGPIDWKLAGKNTLRTLVNLLARGKFSNGPNRGAWHTLNDGDYMVWNTPPYSPPKNAPFTASCWVYLDTVAAQVFWSMANAADTAKHVYLWVVGATGVMQFNWESTTGQVTDAWCPAGTAVAGQWLNFIVTYDGVWGAWPHFKIYKNGVEVSNSGGASGGTQDDAGGKWYFSSTSAGYRLRGSICQFAIWDRILDASERALVSQSIGYSPALIPSGLRAYFKGNSPNVLTEEISGQAAVPTGATTLWRTGMEVRDFNGAGDRLDWDSPYTFATTDPLTVSMWVNMDVLEAVVFWIAHNAIGTEGNLYLWSPTVNGSFTLAWNGATSLYRTSAVGSMVAGKWYHLLATYAGVYTDFHSIKLYNNGVETAYLAGSNGVAPAKAVDGKWSLGGWIFSDAYNMDGKLAQVGIWKRVLTPAEITALASGMAYNPMRIPSDLKFAWSGNTEKLVNLVTGAVGTPDGTTRISGTSNAPSIIYP